MFGIFHKEKTLESLKKDLKYLHALEISLWELLNQDKKELILENIKEMNSLIIELNVEFSKFHLDIINLSQNIQNEIKEELKILEQILITQINELNNISKLSKEEIEVILNQNKKGNPHLSTTSSTILSLIEKIEKQISKNITPYSKNKMHEDIISSMLPKKIYNLNNMDKKIPTNEKESDKPRNPLLNEPTTPVPIAIYRDENGKIHFDSTLEHKFASDRDFSRVKSESFGIFGTGWENERSMREIPLYISDEEVINITVSNDWNEFPLELKKIFESKKILRTSGNIKTNYSIIMSTTLVKRETDISEGRTGTLLENGKPIIIIINNKDFIVEIKGVGSPDENNQRILSMSRKGYFGSSYKQYGGANVSEIEREFEHLEIQRNENLNFFNQGNSIRALAKIEYKTFPLYYKNGEVKQLEQSYLIRLSPSNIRASYRQNSFFNKHNTENIIIVKGIAIQYAQLMMLPSCLLHSTIHPENFVKAGNTYILTDFSDCRKLKDIEDPYDFITQVLHKIEELPGITDEEILLFYETILNNLTIFISWDKSTGYQGFIDALWGQFLASKVYMIRKGSKKYADECKRYTTEYLNQDYVQKNILSDSVLRMLINNIISFLEKEINLLKYINEPVAIESLRIAKNNLDLMNYYLEHLEEFKEFFVNNQEKYYNMLYLSYME